MTRPGQRRGPGALARDPVALAYAAAVALAGVQALVLDDTGGILRAGLPYLLALAAVLAVRRFAPRDALGVGAWLRVVAGAGTLLAVWLVGAFLPALLLGWGEPSSFYRVKAAVTSPVGDHNTAAGLLLPPLVAAAVLAVDDARWRPGLAAVTLGLVATLSRGAAVVLVAVAALAWLVASRREVAAWLLGAAAAAATGILGLAAVLDASPPAQARLAETPGRLGASVLGRLDLAERGLTAGLEHPWLGVGLGRFATVAGDLPPPHDHAHQLLAHALAEGGVVLLAVAATVPAVLLWRAWRRAPGPLRDVTLLGGLALVAHAQMEILGGRVGYEVLLALLATLVAAGAGPTRSSGGGGNARPSGGPA